MAHKQKGNERENIIQNYSFYPCSRTVKKKKQSKVDVYRFIGPGSWSRWCSR